MNVKLESIYNGVLSIGENRCILEGEVVEAKFSTIGVRLLKNNTWSLEMRYVDIEKYFKVYNQ